MESTHKLYRISSLVFFLSGCSALAFETIWFRVTSVVLGSSIFSASAVLMAFMTGLGIGNAIVAFRGERIRDPIGLYVIIEILIGISGVAIIFFLPFISYLVGNALADLVENTALLNFARFTVAFLVLLIPAIAMGCTLPVLHKALNTVESSFAKSIAHLYGWNTFGAVAGTLITEFFLIYWLGINATALFACLLNFLAALILYLSFSGSYPQLTAQSNPLSFPHHKKLLFGPAIAGMLLLALEVIWFRYLSMIQRETTTLFSIMLAVVLFGIASGGMVVSRSRISEKKIDSILLFLAVVAAIVTTLSYLLFQAIYSNYFDELRASRLVFSLAAVLLMFPICFVSGMLFPLFGEKLHQAIGVNTQSSGTLTLANTFGAAFGSGLATFLLLPVLGIELSVLAISLSYIVIAILSMLRSIARTRPKYCLQTIVVATIGIVAIFPFGGINNSYQVFAAQVVPGEKLVTVKESIYSTLQYYKKEVLGEAESYRLVTNGYSMSGTNFAGERYMKLFAYLPYIMQGELEDVLLISYGVGNTAQAITQLDSMQSLDIVDVSRDIVALSAPVHEEIGYAPLQDSRVNVHIEDGRFFLQTSDTRYDLITGEPPPPKSPSIVNLYTREFFQLTRQHLKPRGIVSYWLPAHDLLASDSAAIISAFYDVFENCSLWNGFDRDFILIGTNSELPLLDMEDIQSH